MPTAAHLLLSLQDASPPGRAAAPPGTAPGIERGERFLNAAGRWAAQGSVAAPWLVWRPEDDGSAAAAADRAAAAHQRAVTVCLRMFDDASDASTIRRFDDSCASALLGPAPHSAAKARRLRTEADKLAAFCMVVRAAATATDHAAFTEVSRAASTALRSKFGGGSITTAFAWLAGPLGRQALASVLAGEVELTGALSIREVIDAVALAKESEHLRTQG